MPKPKNEPQPINMEVRGDLHARLVALKPMIDTPYGPPSLKGLLNSLLSDALDAAEKKARA
jgi:hypothetical protein